MKKAIFTLSLLLLAFCKMATGQDTDNHLDKDNMSFFKEAELVVEGRFLKPLHAYAVKDADGKEHYYGICPVITYRVFKGDAKAGDTVYVTREGTSLYDAKSHPYDGSYKKFYDENYSGPRYVSEVNYLTDFDQMSWYTDGRERSLLTDPDKLREMKVEDVLKFLFNENSEEMNK